MVPQHDLAPNARQSCFRGSSAGDRIWLAVQIQRRPGDFSTVILIYADHAQCHLMKIGLQGLVKLGELRPQNLSDEPFGCANHDRVAPLPIIAIGLVISYLVATRSK